MKRRTLFHRFPSRLALAAALLLASLQAATAAVPSLTAKELHQARADGKIALLIDVRTNAEFERGHIPGAINIPDFVIETRSLPPAGTVALYGDGLGRIDDEAAATALSQKPGIQPLLLAGGIAAWESAGFPTTHPKGLADAELPVITYQQLKKVQARGIVLADLRGRGEKRPGGQAQAAAFVSDLRGAFPNARVIEPGEAQVTQGDPSKGNPGQSPNRPDPAMMRELGRVDASKELIVLIDDGDGSAERTAMRLRSAGNRRIVILAGGESILQRDGRPGLERLGYGLTDPTRETSHSAEENLLP